MFMCSRLKKITSVLGVVTPKAFGLAVHKGDAILGLLPRVVIFNQRWNRLVRKHLANLREIFPMELKRLLE